MSAQGVATKAVEQKSIPLVDLRRQYLTIRDQVDEAIRAVIDKTAFAGGPFVERFEKNFARAVDAKHAVGVSSGTSAIELALRALEIGAGDEVILPVNTFIATAEAVVFAGATPVFADIDETTYTMDPVDASRRITSKTRAIIPVHLYGQAADLDAFAQIAERHKLVVIEDAAQAHAAEYRGRKIGSIGAATCFSFYPGKNLGAYGEAGAVTTNDDAVADRLRLLREHGSRTKYVHEVVGHNHRMDGIQGAVLDAKLPFLENWTERRREIASRYATRLRDSAVGIPEEAAEGRHVYHLYVVRVANRDEIRNRLSELGIGAGIHYPLPLHLQPAFAYLNISRGAFPVAEEVAEEILSLPMFPEMTDEEVDYVAEHLLEAVAAVQQSR